MLLKRWTVAPAILAIFFFVLAVSHEVYDITSPASLSWHILLRKAYSIAACAGLGYALRRALAENAVRTNVPATCVLGVAAYSAAIEVAQHLHGATEGLGWNAFDTACGAVGGAVASIDVIFRRRRV